MINSKILFILLLTIVQIYSQTCFGIDKSSTQVCSASGICVSDNKCSCYSGFDGNQCENKAKSTCKWNTNVMTKTDFYPTADPESIDFEDDKLEMSIKAPLVTDRLDTKIFIQNASYAQCAYPGNNVINQLDESGKCFNRFNYSLPWSTGKNCGWETQNTQDQRIYNGNMYIEQTENIGLIRGQSIQRYIKRVIPLSVKFQTRVSVSTDIKVFAPVAMFTAITKQEYIEGPPKSGDFEFITSLQYPFQLDTTNLNVDEFPSGLVPTLKDISDECKPNQPCTQKFAMKLEVKGACSFTGTYKMKLKLKCHPSITNAADCPLDSNRDVTIEISANSENFCSVVNVNINLSGTLKSYQDVSHTIRKDAFLLGQTSFFKAEVSSPKATLKETKIVRVQWEQGNSTKVLFDNFAITTEGTTEKFALGATGSNDASFKFDLEKEYMNIAEDSNADFKVSALLEVKYQSIDGQTETTFSDASFSLLDLKTLQAEVDPVEGSQQSKYSEEIKIFGIYEPKNNGGSVISIGLSLMIFISSIYVFLM
eukprot:gene12524-6347_t